MVGISSCATEICLETLTRGTYPNLKKIIQRAYNMLPLTAEEGLELYSQASTSLLLALANGIKERLHGDRVYFNRNVHIEPTNICVFTCKFCAYARALKSTHETWFLSSEEMLEIVKRYKGTNLTEIHIVGGVHPRLKLDFFIELIKEIRKILPGIHIKAFTAVEYDYMFKKAKLSIQEGLTKMIEAGLQSIPGGGAEIFHPEIRQQICADKCSSERWLEIHQTAHELGIPSNATMLYGHIEKLEHRIDHMSRLRQLQEKTNGFNVFIPLKFRNGGISEMSHVPETTQIDDLRTYAFARIFMYNFPHIKAYWPMIGRESAQILLSAGVDDLDGTIDDSTKIYSMSGAEEQSPRMSSEELIHLIKRARRRPIERDTNFKVLKDHGAYAPEDVLKNDTNFKIL